MRQQFTILCLAATFSLVHSLGLIQAENVYNGSFDVVGANGPQTIHDGQSPTLTPGSISAADGWGVWHNTNGSTETNWLSYDEVGIDSIDPSQDRETDKLLRIEASHALNGIVQAFAPSGGGPMTAEGSVWVYLNGPGRVGVGIGNAGSTQILEETTLAGQWEELRFSNAGTPINEIVLYATSDGAEFYVDRVSVTSVPEPAVGIPLLLSCLGVAAFRRRRSIS